MKRLRYDEYIRYFSFVFVLSMVIHGYAQKERVSGYLGKRLSIGAGVKLSPSVEPQKSIGSDMNSQSAGGLSLDFSINSAGKFYPFIVTR